MSSDEDVCRICHKPRLWHREHLDLKHAFTTTGGLRPREVDIRSSDPGAQGANKTLPPGDPVVRMALIRKGLLTPEDLTQVEDELKAMGSSWS